MYARDDKNPLRDMISKALLVFEKQTSYEGAYDILRWAKRGLIQVDPTVSSQEFVDWYPRDQGYVLIRLARLGKLSYKEQL